MGDLRENVEARGNFLQLLINYQQWKETLGSYGYGVRSTRAWAQVTENIFQSVPVNMLSNIWILIFIPVWWHMAMLEFYVDMWKLNYSSRYSNITVLCYFRLSPTQ